MTKKNKGKKAGKAKAKLAVIVRKQQPKVVKAFEDPVKCYRDMLSRPFETLKSYRGPFANCATVPFSVRQRCALTVSGASGSLFVCVQPCGLQAAGGFLISASPASTAGAITTTDFTPQVWSSQAAAAGLFSQARCLGGGARLVNNAAWANTQGNIAAGYLPPCAMVNYTTTTYAQMQGNPMLGLSTPGDPVEVLWENAIAAGLGRDSFPIATQTSVGVAQIFQSHRDYAPYGQAWFVLTGFAVGTAVTVEVAFHYEANVFGTSANFLEPDKSSLSTAQAEKVEMELMKGLYNKRVGMSALVDKSAGPAAAAAAAGTLLHHAQTTGLSAVGSAVKELVVDSALHLANAGIGAMTSGFQPQKEYFNVRTGEIIRN